MLHDEYTALASSEDNHWWYKRLRFHILTAIKADAYKNSQRSTTTLFDAGCGTGGLIHHLRTKYPNLISSFQCCEPNAYARTLCLRRNITPLPFAILDLPKSLNNTFEIVTCIDVLYHNDVEPLDALKRLAKLVKPGGMIIMNNAALNCFKRSHDENVLGVRRFNSQQINKLISAAGLRSLQIYYWNTLLAPCLLLSIFLESLKIFPSSKASQAATPSSLANRLFSTILAIESLLPKHSLLRPFGTSVFAVAVKPKH